MNGIDFDWKACLAYALMGLGIGALAVLMYIGFQATNRKRDNYQQCLLEGGTVTVYKLSEENACTMPPEPAPIEELAK